MTTLISSLWDFCSRHLLALPFLPQKTQLGLAHRLPPEILLLVVENLDHVSAMLLSLTSRTLFQICSHRLQSFRPLSGYPAMDAANKETLLLLLEKDLPSFYYCHKCVLLHRWKISRDRSDEISTDHFDGADSDCDWFSDRQFNFIPYHFARVLMNRHFFGTPHGLPLQKLSSKLHDYYDRDDIGTRIHGERRARIVDDQLMLCETFTIRNSKGSARRLRAYIDRYRIAICEHIGSADLSVYGHRRLPELSRDSSTRPDYFAACHQSVKSCRVCLTDCSTTISWHGQKKGWVVEFVIYKLLGSVRSPTDWKWQTISVYCRYIETQRSTLAMYGPGTIRCMWSEVDEVPLELEGEWLNTNQGFEWYEQYRLLHGDTHEEAV